MYHRRKSWKKLSGIDKILVFSTTLLIIFTVTMIVLFVKFQAIPDSLVVAFFSAFSIETVNTVRLMKYKRSRGNTQATEVYENDV